MMVAPVKIACIQMSVVPADKDACLATAERMIREAFENGAELLVLPEVFNGPAENTRVSTYELAEPIPGGRTSELMLGLAKEYGVYICGSFIEQEGIDLFNTSILAGPEGLVGKYRKLHLCGNEPLKLEPGNLGIPVFHTRLGRIALLICLDAYYPEAFRIAALQGADIVCVSFNAGDFHEERNMPEGWYTAIPVLCQAAALSNHIFVVGCNRVGRCGNYVSAGQSVIAGQWGMPIVPMAPHDREAILYAEVDLADSRRKHFSQTDSRLANRRLDVYSDWLGYDTSRYPKQQ